MTRLDSGGHARSVERIGAFRSRWGVTMDGAMAPDIGELPRRLLPVLASVGQDLSRPAVWIGEARDGYEAVTVTVIDIGAPDPDRAVQAVSACTYRSAESWSPVSRTPWSWVSTRDDLPLPSTAFAWTDDGVVGLLVCPTYRVMILAGDQRPASSPLFEVSAAMAADPTGPPPYATGSWSAVGRPGAPVGSTSLSLPDVPTDQRLDVVLSSLTGIPAEHWRHERVGACEARVAQRGTWVGVAWSTASLLLYVAGPATDVRRIVHDWTRSRRHLDP